ncbi:hypothetical protein [Asanoa siamensis]|uniref:Lipoprotein LprG n=1 Tax=Asanoa siamensis TaxID=926357 RepID=A0ABQ4CTI0_9ACTN|nr:hypothetical protein [Asanoa siamensis]GIF74577.1 hypothetical protein Asi02nite_40950 [Asanoa siamensis]
MWIRRCVTGLGLAVVLAMTGCGDAAAPVVGAPATTSAAAPADPRAELAAAVRKLDGTTMKISQKSPGTTSTGALDAGRRLGDMRMQVSAAGRSVEMEVRAVGSDAYVRAEGLPGSEGRKWLKLDGSRLAGTPLDVFPADDPSGANRLVNALSDISKDGPGRFSGTIDLTKTSPNKTVAAMGDKVRALPFTATVDDEGRLSSTEIDMTSVDASLGKTTTTYSDFGTAVNVKAPPAAETVPASDELIKLMTGS